MKKILLPLVSALLFAAPAAAQKKERCGTMENLERLKAMDPQLETRMKQIEAQTQEWIRNNRNKQNDDAVITIPVVVHIVYRTNAENISDAQINSGIQVLNEDFRKLNADTTKTPSAFKNLAGDAQVEFCLAKRDPQGNASSGIIRKQTTVTSWGTDDKVKYSSSGGSNAWPRDKYLNLWICNLSGGLLGYAQFPGGAAATDGVVVLYTGFGRVGTVSAPYNLGRTTTHEVGHWLNLYHIWGDSNCGNDNVSDTPTQESSNSGCPSFPNVSCSNGPNGDMFCNFMDYTDDNCMNMFSKGQVSRMAASLNGSRSSLKNSDGCASPAAPPVADFAADVTSTCEGTVKFTDKSSNAPTSWQWDFGDGTTSSQQNPTHNYTSSGTYTVKLTAINAYGNDIETKTSYITVNMPAGPSVQNGKRCGPGIVSLSASPIGNGLLKWYDAATGGTMVNTGTAYGPSLSSTTTYYVEEVIDKPVQKTGEADSSLGGGGFFTANTERRVYFDVSRQVIFKSFKTYANSAGNRTIEILDGNGTVVQTKTVNIAKGESRVALDITLDPGTSYAIKIASGSTVDLYRNNNGGTGYPYSISGLISITGTDAGSNPTFYYYYFYDWEIQELPCVSPRVPVTGTIHTTPAKPVITQNGSSLSGPSGYSYQWYLNGNVIGGATGKTYSPVQGGNYTLEITDANGCKATSDPFNFTATGVQPASPALPAVIVPNPSGGLVTILNLTGGETYQVFTLQGKLVGEGTAENGKAIHLPHLARGSYLFRLIRKDGTVEHKRLDIRK